MEIIEGFAAAKARLSREAVSGPAEASPSIKSRLKEIFGRDIEVESAVAQILADVRAHGDSAVLDYTFKIDGFRLSSLEVGRDLIKEAYNQVDKELIEALKVAAGRIRLFHQEQKDCLFQGVRGTEWGQLVRPLERLEYTLPAALPAIHQPS
jgi:histidinol dehydrogenase